uniref:Aquaporin-6 n=1 Tax=Milnesium tardigradum TaxID=46460 RepID=AQP6_MILTA|nr:RecName: Full=Aquaporin-6; Short=AQP-6 [Milnesium tardigradum]AEP14560.2 aquaporin 6 [Milnesium tardigradum]
MAFMDKSEVRQRLQKVLQQCAKAPTWSPKEEVRQSIFWKSIRAELIGSLVLMVFSCSRDSIYGPVSYGCTYAILSYCFKSISAHFNPVITIAALLLRSITPFRCISLVLAQTLGTLSGASVCYYGLSNETETGSAPISPVLNVSPAKGFGYEFFGTFVIILTMSSYLDCNDYVSESGDSNLLPLIFGLSVGLSSGMARQATGGFLNPMRAFSLALFELNHWSNHYIYWIGPIFGCLLAVFTFDYTRPIIPNRDSNNRINFPTFNKNNKYEVEMQPETEITLATLA